MSKILNLFNIVVDFRNLTVFENYVKIFLCKKKGVWFPKKKKN